MAKADTGTSPYYTHAPQLLVVTHRIHGNGIVYTISGRPYDGKASDMWALGVLLYTTLYGQFPFYDNDPQELFRKIRAADYIIPE